MNHFLIYLYFQNIIIRSIKFLFDVAVIGSGPGGAITSCILSESGFKTILFEDGPSSPPDSEFTFSLEEINYQVQKWWSHIRIG